MYGSGLNQRLWLRKTCRLLSAGSSHWHTRRYGDRPLTRRLVFSSTRSNSATMLCPLAHLKGGGAGTSRGLEFEPLSACGADAHPRVVSTSAPAIADHHAITFDRVHHEIPGVKKGGQRHRQQDGTDSEEDVEDPAHG